MFKNRTETEPDLDEWENLGETPSGWQKGYCLVCLAFERKRQDPQTLSLEEKRVKEIQETIWQAAVLI